MAQNITKPENYSGLFDLALNNIDDYFNEFAFEIEKTILRGDGVIGFGLLGDEVYIDLIADLDDENNPQTEPYISLINGGSYIAADGKKTLFCGVRKMLTYFVYASYIKDNNLTNFQSGTVSIDQENAANSEVKFINHKAHKRWNLGVDLFNGEVYDYLLFYQSSFTNWDFTRAGKFITMGIK